MEGQKFDEYRQRINRATNILTETQARVQLLNQLAAAVGDNGKRDKSKLTDEENYLIEELDSLLYDPFFRENYWLKDNEIIHKLVIHILGYRDTLEIIEERREFSLHDLPNDVHHIQKAGEKSRSFYTELWSNDDIKKITVDWLNLHLDEAITQVLNLGREDLQRLMREVRETLAEQGIELVLLIEDFAKLQGIDRELLEAVLARPQQPGSKPLCSMRTALACTTGYFKGLIDTVQQRVTFSVNLDVEKIGEQSLVTQTDIQELVSKYLNAVRLENEVILNWASSDQQADLNAESLTNACRDCEHREACHAGFGAVNEIGLYPFNAIALKQMFAKVNQKEFNPWILIKDVLKYTLENGYDDIQKGLFPSVSLQKHFGKMRLSAMLQQDINIKDPQNFDRRQVLLDLWDDGDELCDLPIELHTAFNLPPIGVKIKPLSQITTTVEEQKQKNVSVTEPKPVVNTSIKLDGIPENLAKKIEILNGWNNQSILPQGGVTQDLRAFIFPAIVQYIEWDNEMLLEKTFASNSSKYFKQRNIVFYSPRVTREQITGVKLTLPLNPDDADNFRETAIAFQGILLYSHYKHWKFKNGDRYFRTYSKQLEKWSQYVLTAIRRYPRESGEAWNPLPAAVELLSISSTMAGHFREKGISNITLDKKLDDLVNFIIHAENNFGKTPDWIIDTENFNAKILQKGIDNLTKTLKQQLSTDWQIYLSQNMPSTNQEMLNLLSKVQAFSHNVQQIQRLDKEIKQVTYPKNTQELELAQTRIEELKQCWHSLSSDEVPGSVLSLLRAAANQGASLNLLTPEVLNWVNSYGIADSLKIRLI
jgi:hypothetical protein